jgi:predicted nuclease of restriction endonuclease-like RecB superfamily
MGPLPTIVECIAEATAQLEQLRRESLGEPAREFSLAITALEDAQMRATRGLAKVQGKFAPVDLQA